MADNKKLLDDEKRKLIGFYKENIKTTDLAALELFQAHAMEQCCIARARKELKFQ